MRYTERLGRDVTKAGENVFGSAASSAAVTGDIKSSNSRAGSNTTGSPKVGQRKEGSSSSSSSSSLLSPEMEKLKLCKEDFEAATVAFQQTLKTGAEKVNKQKYDSIATLRLLTIAHCDDTTGGCRCTKPNEGHFDGLVGAKRTSGRSEIRPGRRQVRRPASGGIVASHPRHPFRHAAGHVHERSERV